MLMSVSCALSRYCPCGKTRGDPLLLCHQSVPVCGDTCDKLLQCGTHRCVNRCHVGPCSTVGTVAHTAVSTGVMWDHAAPLWVLWYTPLCQRCHVGQMQHGGYCGPLYSTAGALNFYWTNLKLQLSDYRCRLDHYVIHLLLWELGPLGDGRPELELSRRDYFIFVLTVLLYTFTLLTSFCVFVLFHSCCCHAQMIDKTFLREVLI